MSSLQVGMRRNAYVEPRWICVDKWTMRYSDIHIAYCLLPMAYGLWPMAYGRIRFDQAHGDTRVLSHT